MPKFKRRVMAWGIEMDNGKLMNKAFKFRKTAYYYSTLYEKVVKVWIERVDKRRKG